MILQCPSCAARFLVADSMVPPGGRTVKCGKCANQWFVTQDSAAPGHQDFAALTAQAYAEAPPQPHDPKNLPALARRPLKPLPFQIAVGVLGLAWMVLAIFAYFPGWHTGLLSGVYGGLGVTDTSDLVFSDVSMERQQEGARTRFLISGSIANHGAVARVVPYLRVQVKDKEGEVIWGHTYPANETVQPGGIYPFRIENVETTFASRATSIVMDLGNNFELMVR